MKLKELERPAVQVWSPASQYPVHLATGTSAQQLDASFSTNGTLEIFEVDFRDPSLDLKCKGVLSVSSRFHKLIWGSFGNGLLEGSGVIAGGGDNGMLTLYNVTHILSSGKEPVIAQKQKHTGAVRALDFNPFQSNLLASGASDSEIFIWDLNNLSVPMTPGSKSQQPQEDIKALAWNRQVQHILSSAHPSGKAVVWDLRKNEPIIKVSDHSNRFGGKLVTFGLPSSPPHDMPQPYPRLVFISQVTTESEFLMRSAELQEALGSGSLLNYCQSKSQQASLQSEKMLWQFLKVTLEQDSRIKFLKLLGYSKDELQNKVATWLKSDLGLGESPQPKGSDLNGNRQQAFYSQASKHTTGEASASSAFFDGLVPQNMTPWEIPITEDADGLLSQALLLGELGPAVELCLKEERFADAIILAQVAGTDMLKQTQKHYLAKRKTKISPLLAYVVQKNWKDMVCACSLKNWREALALLLTYSSPERFPELCDILGTRMEQEGSSALISEARLCYVCSGSVERLVESWAKCPQALSPMALQDLMEKVMVLNRSLELLQGRSGVNPGPATTHRVTQYVSHLAAQGSLATAMNFLPSDCAQLPVQQLRDRLFHAQGSAVLGQQPPSFPFPRIVVGATPNSKETLSHRLGSQPSHQVPTPSPKPSLFTSQSSLVTSLRPSHPNPYQGSRMQTISDYRVPGPQVSQPLPLDPRTRPALSQPQLLGGQRAQAPNPVGFLGTWPFPDPPPSMASLDIMQPGSPSLPETSRLLPLLPMRPLGPSPMVSQPPGPPASFPVAYPPRGPAVPCFSTLPATAILTHHPAPQDSWKDAPAPKGNLQRKKLPETFMPPAPITAPVMSLSPELQGILPSQSPVSSVGQAPPGAPGEFSLQQLPPEKVERKELPPEHQSLKTSFEALLQRCALSATDLKTKRKLDEAAQRLEYLYEKLCEGTLSPHVLDGLHEVARCVDAGSFEQGLTVHAQVAGCSSFSEVSSFMPVLKAVLNIAHKMQI
ncbi:protein transport protein Sec31B isoform X6 [Otolemur garnettii]|uniref:protein transport protein Sec31B isoform X6 n=1 Tax=Otolemur garnettii TaxID=30611 RepID=UPI000C7F3C0D|nr:protein transport protein Sec31B isoform X6 [Otolemur garnettii]